MPSPLPPQFFTIREIADRLRVSSSSVYQLVESGRLAHHRIGTGRGAIRISETDLLTFLSQCRQSTSQPKAERPVRCQTLKHLKLN